MERPPADPAAERYERQARACIERGCAALDLGDTEQAKALFDRACRLAPADPTAALLLASTLAAEPARAEQVLQAAHRRDPRNRSILAALAAAAARRGDAAQAAARLHAMLSSGAPLGGDAFSALADSVARDSGAPGWIGLSADGTLRIAGRSVSVKLGDAALKFSGRAGSQAVTLPEGWTKARQLTATARGRPLIGSPIDVAAVLRVEGCVTNQTPAVASGWAWHPNDPDRPVRLALVNGAGGLLAHVLAESATPAIPAGDGVSRARGFRIALPESGGPLWLRVPDGSLLPGGPILCGEEEAAARTAARSLAASSPADRWRPIPAAFAETAPPRPRAAALTGGWTVILLLDPAHPMQAACLSAVAALRLPLIAVYGGDAGEDTAAPIEAQGVAHVRVPFGSGPALLNAGLRHAAASARTGPLLLLTRPCVLPRGLPARLAAAMRADPGAGIVQPLCFAPPDGDGSTQAALRLDRLSARCNAKLVEPLALAGGPVLALHPECLKQTGLLREEAYAGTAAALADFGLRARHLGWAAALACNCFVAEPPESGAAPVRAALAEGDAATLERLHPGLRSPAGQPGAQARRRLAMADWAEGRRAKNSVIFITHADGGGVERRVADCAGRVQAEGGRAIVIRPVAGPSGGAVWRVSDGTGNSHPDLWFRAPDELPDMVEMLRADRAGRVELHHAASHHESICGLAPALGIPYDVIVHDFSMICPRVTFVGGYGRYCGEPADVSECDACIADHGARLGDLRIGRVIPVAALRAASASLAEGAARIVAPSADTARRVRRYFQGAAPVVQPWEDDRSLTEGVPRRPRRVSAGPVTVCLAGAIGQDKGFDVLLACARDAARRQLDLSFKLVGHTIDDERLMDTGRVFITGEYEEHETLALIRAQNADIGFLPSVWPETWCYALSALWRAGLWTLAFALGAPAERIAATGAGRTVPPGMPPARLNDLMLGLFAQEVGAHG
jgi:glycosyltransferase involved in cell wall biosynthesis